MLIFVKTSIFPFHSESEQHYPLLNLVNQYSYGKSPFAHRYINYFNGPCSSSQTVGITRGIRGCKWDGPSESKWAIPTPFGRHSAPACSHLVALAAQSSPLPRAVRGLVQVGPLLGAKGHSVSGLWFTPILRNMVLLYVYLQNSMEHRDMD